MLTMFKNFRRIFSKDMAKTKPAKASATPVVATPAKVLNGVKSGRVAKTSQPEKTKSKDLGKSAAVKKELEKKIRKPAPSESEADDSDSSDDSSNASDSDAAKVGDIRMSPAISTIPQAWIILTTTFSSLGPKRERSYSARMISNEWR